MAVNLNHGVVQGRVVSILENDNNTRVTIVSNNDYRKGDEWINQAYFLPVTFFGSLGESLVQKVKKGDFITLEVKIASYKPRDSDYHTLTLNGVSYHMDVASQQQESRPKANNTNKKKTDRSTSKQSTEDEDDWDSLPPWGDEG